MNFWDEKYRQSEYVYGTQPNAFFREELLKIPPGFLFLPAEGEGRNAWFALVSNWKVDAIDSSKEAKNKAEKLCKKHIENLNYEIHNLENYPYSASKYDALALIYAHLSSNNRRSIHKNMMSSLKKGGLLILEAFSKEQIHYSSGGPKNLDMLYSLDEVIADFDSMEILKSSQEIIFLEEGKHHLGEASVIRILAKKI
jgi:hypothetical protein